MSEHVSPGEAGAQPQQEAPRPEEPQHQAPAAAATPPTRSGLRWIIAAGFGAGLVVGIAAAILTTGLGTFPAGGGGFGLAFLGLYNPFVTLLVLILIGLAVWYFVTPASARRSAWRNESALDILRQRFARGEIDTEEYERRAEVLRRG